MSRTSSSQHPLPTRHPTVIVITDRGVIQGRSKTRGRGSWPPIFPNLNGLDQYRLKWQIYRHSKMANPHISWEDYKILNPHISWEDYKMSNPHISWEDYKMSNPHISWEDYKMSNPHISWEDYKMSNPHISWEDYKIVAGHTIFFLIGPDFFQNSGSALRMESDIYSFIYSNIQGVCILAEMLFFKYLPCYTFNNTKLQKMWFCKYYIYRLKYPWSNHSYT